MYARRSASALVGLLATVIASGAVAASPGSSAKQVSCAAAKRDVARTTGAARTAAQRRLKRCEAGNRANKRVLASVRDSHFVGTRGDGAVVDWTFCANGRYVLATTSGGSTGTTRGSRWRTADATYKSAGTFTAVLEDPAKGSSVGIARRGGKWQAGVSRSFGELESLGPVKRSPATTC